MSEDTWGRRAHGLLLNAIQKRAWGESLDELDPSDLVDVLQPAISDAIEAVDEHGTKVTILLDLYRRYAGSDSETVSMLLRASKWTGSGALTAACERAMQQAGPEVIELLRDVLTDDADEETTVDFLFGVCRVAVDAIADPGERLHVLRTVYEQAVDATNDPAIAESLRERLEVALKQDERRAVEMLLEHYQYEVADDPWPLLEAMIGSLWTGQELASGDQATTEVLMQALRETVADEGVEQLWEGYQYLLSELGEFGGLENAEALLEVYERAVDAVNDSKWVADQLFQICDDIACAHDDMSFWLPDRVQVSQACKDTIDAVGGPTATSKAISWALELAVHGTSDPWGVLAKAFHEVERNASDDKREWIAHAVVRASQRAMSDLMSSALKSAHRAIRDREGIVDLLQQAAERERAFWLFREVQNARGADRQRYVEWLFEALSETGPDDVTGSFAGEPDAPPLFRAFMVAATALNEPTTAANLLATVYMATQRRENGIDLEHALRALAEALAALGDPASEATVMYNAYITAIDDGNDPAPAVEALLDATEQAIEEADDPARAVEVLLSGLSVPPIVSPPTPAWATYPYAQTLHADEGLSSPKD